MKSTLLQLIVISTAWLVFADVTFSRRFFDPHAFGLVPKPKLRTYDRASPQHCSAILQFSMQIFIQEKNDKLISSCKLLSSRYHNSKPCPRKETSRNAICLALPSNVVYRHAPVVSAAKERLLGMRVGHKSHGYLH